ncbi:Ubiquitin-conjugating enzyme subunit [Umbelopsis nana]
MASSAANILQKQFKELTRNPVPGFVVDLKDDNIFLWDVAIIGSPKTIYEGGYFKATMTFPEDYPFQPPMFRFNNDFYHPNVYSDGRLCISILHPPGDDPVSGEKAEERWNPTQSVESVLMSIISLLADPNCSSPANVDAGVAYRKDREQFTAIVKAQVEASKQDIPEGFFMPQTEADFMLTAPPAIEEDENFWYDSGDDSEFDEDDFMSENSSQE